MNGVGSSAKLTTQTVALGRFTQVYLTPNNHYGVVIYGVVFGSVLYLSFELAAAIPAAWALVSTSATLAAAFVAFFVGRGVPLKQPSGRA